LLLCFALSSLVFNHLVSNSLAFDPACLNCSHPPGKLSKRKASGHLRPAFGGYLHKHHTPAVSIVAHPLKLPTPIKADPLHYWLHWHEWLPLMLNQVEIGAMERNVD